MLRISLIREVPERYAIISATQKRRNTLTRCVLRLYSSLKPSFVETTYFQGITHQFSQELVHTPGDTGFTEQHLCRSEQVDHGQVQWNSTVSV